MTVPDERSFIDTNIFVYAMEPQPSPKKARAKAIMESALNARDGVISFQIVQEFLSVALLVLLRLAHGERCVSRPLRRDPHGRPPAWQAHSRC
jgi:predicted nucleic acid-binding protein